MRAQKYSDALPLLEWLFLSSPDSVELERQLAECYQRLGSTEAAYKIRKTINRG